MTPTQRTLETLRTHGWTAGIVEKWVPARGGGFRLDLFGIIDVIAIRTDGTLGVQSCGSAWISHLTTLTLTKSESVRLWLADPDRKLELWSWVKRKPRGQRVRWVMRRGIIYVHEGDVRCFERPLDEGS
jgi:hypothetical protein